MIFVTLGSQKFQFNRLLKKVDELIGQGEITEEVFAQIGASDYEPKNYEYKAFLDRKTFEEIMSRCDMVITHGGTGAIIGAVKQGKKVVAIPRLKRFNEHVDDHQLQLITQFKELNLICDCLDVECLGSAINGAKSLVYNEYESNTLCFLESLKEYINS
ncbi:Hypothetical protein Tpal_2017 [Trichococcus palustris]|uniref:Glycosyl transferase family 28 C-terminal domain-containing protein n=1 Tax=Trichococcus palustris TaxID=140314 RepID=A0A143YUX0_9LACT|nr:PssE/Cps14G family polysaccharide biosynthesis glycosyltransferase [Trichococcus palustris]CZQ96505.1 Hypothetical protein Tpal_2017 [Trichococcus palustris]SFK73748.1 UDP-N-acetylglucosamine transferase subunit ALG13 [Trichococcus palustris]